MVFWEIPALADEQQALARRANTERSLRFQIDQASAIDRHAANPATVLGQNADRHAPRAPPSSRRV